MTLYPKHTDGSSLGISFGGNVLQFNLVYIVKSQYYTVNECPFTRYSSDATLSGTFISIHGFYQYEIYLSPKSKLTMLLKNALGGNSKTIMVSNCLRTVIIHEESPLFSTLIYRTIIV